MTAGKFAADTAVPVEASRAEIEATLKRYGARGFLFGSTDERLLVAFEMGGRQVRFTVALPDPGAREFTHATFGARGEQPRTPQKARAEWEQAVRQKWRALLLVIKAKLEAVSAGISVFEDEFLANIVLPSGQLTGDWLRPQLARAYDTGQMPPLLPAPETK